MEYKELAKVVETQKAAGVHDSQILSELKAKHSNLYSAEELEALVYASAPPNLRPSSVRWTRVLTALMAVLVFAHAAS